MTGRRAPSTVPSAAGPQRTARPRLRPLGVRVLAEPSSAKVKVQARLVGTDAHVLGTERLLQRILGHLGQHLGHHLNFAQLLAVDASLPFKEVSPQHHNSKVLVQNVDTITLQTVPYYPLLSCTVSIPHFPVMCCVER